VNLATTYCQFVSKYLATSVCRATSNNLAIKEDRQQAFSDICLPDHKQRFSNEMSKIASNLKTMLRDAGGVMLRSSSQRQGDTCYVQYSAY
jgi:hypothetical protein